MLRIIPRLDIKGEKLIKSINFEGLRVVGDPVEFSKKYYLNNADEILLIDAVASLYGRSHLFDLVSKVVGDVSIPITVGGGVRSLADVEKLLRVGADKVAINTAAIMRPDIITDIAKIFGSQCVVLSVEAKRTVSNSWEAYVDGGRQPTGRNVESWIREAIDRGAGEVLLTSVDREGTRKGLDIDLIRIISSKVQVPVIASGGYSRVSELRDVFDSGCSGVAIADALHWARTSIQSIKIAADEMGIEVRL